MTAEQLRNSILQEAISGRLVPQDPNDEPASVLLERIVAEQNKTLPPKKKKSVSLIAEPEDITPVSGWVYFYIKDLFDTTSGGTPIKGHPEYYDGDIPWVRSGELNSLYLYDSELRITEAGLKNSSAKYFPVDTVVIAMYGATIGKTSIFKRSMTTNQAICGIFPIDGILPEYIYYFLQNKKRDYCSIAFGSGQPNISQEKIKNTIFPLPPLAEQKRIVAKLEELLPMVEQYGKAQKELDELNAALSARLRQSILQEAISGRLVPQDPNDEPASALLERLDVEKKALVANKILKKPELDAFKLEEQPDTIPTGWCYVKLRKICTLLDGEKKRGKYICMDAKFLRGKSQGVYLESGKFVKKGENVILVDGENSGEIFVAPIDGYMGSTFKQLWISQEMYAPYVEYLIKSFKETLRNDKKGAAIPHLKKELFFNLPVGVPPLAEQQRIVAKIEELFAEIDKLTK